MERPIGPDPAPLRGLHLYREFALGGVVREILALRRQRALRTADEKGLREAIARGLRLGFAELVAYERRAAKHTGLLTDALAQFAFVDDRALVKV